MISSTIAEGIIAEAKGADPVESRLSRYQETNSIEDLEALITALAEKGDNAQLAVYAEVLYSRTRTLDDAKRFIQSLDDCGQFERVDNFLDRNPELVETSSEISARYCLTQYHRGNLNEAWTMIQELRTQEDSENLRTLFISICCGFWSMECVHTICDPRTTSKECPYTGRIDTRVSIDVSGFSVPIAVAC